MNRIKPGQSAAPPRRHCDTQPFAFSLVHVYTSPQRRCSSMAEHLICNLEVVGSSPIGGFLSVCLNARNHSATLTVLIRKHVRPSTQVDKGA